MSDKYCEIMTSKTNIHPMLFECWPTAYNAGTTLKKHWVDALCLQEIEYLVYGMNEHMISQLYEIKSETDE